MSPPISKEEMAKGEALLLAEEAAIKKKWCALKGHRWDLPAVNPFNNDILECVIICNRCNAHASVVVTIETPDVGTSVVFLPKKS